MFVPDSLVKRWDLATQVVLQGWSECVEARTIQKINNKKCAPAGSHGARHGTPQLSFRKILIGILKRHDSVKKSAQPPGRSQIILVKKIF